jgi:hypothetical protein
MTEHKMFFGNHWNGNVCVPFAKCSCGAYAKGQQEISKHEEEMYDDREVQRERGE